MPKFKNVLFSLLGVLLVTAGLSGQALTTGKLNGTVTDEDGNPLPGVAIEATSPKLMGKATALTDADGNYRLLALPAGTYRVAFTLQGFKPLIRQDIVLQVADTIKLDVSLSLGAIEEEVTVVGQSPLIDVKSTTKGMTLTKEVFELLPRGRNFDTLVTAVAGVNTEAAFGGGGLSVDGASSAENMFYLDGTDIGATTTGLRQQSAAFEFVDEVQIVAGGYQAEFGGALGGVVNVITRQGGNEFHGELIGFYEGSKLTGKERDTLRLNPYDQTKSEYVNYQDLYGKDLIHRYEGGFSLGGYVFKDRLWFFGSFLPVYRPQTRHVKFLTGNVEADYIQKQYNYNFQAKLTAQPWQFLRLGASFVNNFYKYRGNLPARAGTDNPNPTTPYDQYGYDYPNWTVSGFADLTFGANAMLNLRAGRFFYNVTNQQVQPTVTRWSHAGYGTTIYPDIPAAYQKPAAWINRPSFSVTTRQERYKNHVTADFTYFMNLGGEHAWKLGAQWVKQGENVLDGFHPDYANVYLYWGMPTIVATINYGMGKYGHYEVIGNAATGPYGSAYDVSNDRYALYIQDSWTIADRFTINAGIRAESEYLPPYTTDIPAGISKDFKPMEFDFKEKLAPRIGFIWDLRGDATLKVFGTYGLYYDVIKTYSAVHAYAGFKWKTAYYTLDTYEWDKIGVDGNYPGTLQLVYDWRHPSFETTDPDMRPVSQREYSLGGEYMIRENLSATVRFVQKHLRYAIEDVGFMEPGVGEIYYETNPGYGYSLHVGNGTGRMDPTYPETPKAKREYYAVNFSLDKRLADNWLAGFSYTWSRLTGNTSGVGSSDEWQRVGPYVERNFDNWAMSWTKEGELMDGPLATDRPHYFKFYGAYTFPFRLTFGTTIFLMSGTPVTEEWYLLDAHQYPFNRGYVRNGESGNDIEFKRTPWLFFTNLYAEYNLRLAGRMMLQFNVNIDNLFNVVTARRMFQGRTWDDLGVNEDQVFADSYDLLTAPNYIPDPRFLMGYEFYPPISVRLGAKFIF